MPQERKSRFCGISTIFFQYCFMSETQVLMTISNFSELFLQIISWKGFIFKWEGHRGETINFDGGRGVKKSQDGGGGGSHLWETLKLGEGENKNEKTEGKRKVISSFTHKKQVILKITLGTIKINFCHT